MHILSTNLILYALYWYEELTNLKRPWCWERLKAGGEGDDRGWDGWMASPTQWTWVNSRSWWWTGRPGVLQSMRSQRIGHDWVTVLNWTDALYIKIKISIRYFSVRWQGYYVRLSQTFGTVKYAVKQNVSGNLVMRMCEGFIIILMQRNRS